MNGLQSLQTPLPFGVPQSSVLGPVLFILYTQQFFDLVRYHAVSHPASADDKQLYKVSILDEIQQTIKTIQNCITDL